MISLPYIILIALLALCAACYEYTDSEKQKNVSTMAAIAIFFFFFAFRGYVGTDWTNYTASLENAEWSDFFEWSLDEDKIQEPGFLLLTLLCKFVYNDYFFYVFVCIAIDTFLLLRFFQRWKVTNIAFALMVFSTFGGPQLMFNLLRNMIALCILLNALEYITERKPWHYFSLCVLALSFHLSALVFIPLYFFLHFRVNKWLYLGIFIAVVAFYFSRTSFIMLIANLLGVEGAIGSKVLTYTEYYSSAGSIRLITMLEHFTLVFFVLLFYDELIEKSKKQVLLFNSLLIFLVFNYIFSEFLVLSLRLSLLFYFAYWLLWTDVLNTLYIKNNKRLMFSLFFLYCVSIQIGNFHEPTMQYDNILLGHKSYHERMKIFNKTFKEFGK